MINIPTKIEKINIQDSTHFDVPKREAGRVPSLPRPVVQAKTIRPKVPSKFTKETVERQLSVAGTMRPLPPSNSKVVPKSKEEPNLLDLI